MVCGLSCFTKHKYDIVEVTFRGSGMRMLLKVEGLCESRDHGLVGVASITVNRKPGHNVYGKRAWKASKVSGVHQCFSRHYFLCQ